MPYVVGCIVLTSCLIAIRMVEFSIDILPLTSVNGYQENSQGL